MTTNDAGQPTGQELRAERRLQKELVLELGYQESKKQALFYLDYGRIVFFVDFRHISKDSRDRRARFGWTWNEEAVQHPAGALSRKRAVLLEGMRLIGAGVKLIPPYHDQEGSLMVQSMRRA